MNLIEKVVENLKYWLGLGSQNYLKQEELCKFANNVISRAEGGLYFLRQCLQLIHKGGTDSAWSRSIYILFSYNFELILKSRLILDQNGTTKGGLIEGLRSHDLAKLSKKLSKNKLNDINIKTIQKRQISDFKEYELETTDSRKIIIQDFVDVRYDFLENKFRSIDHKESIRMKEEIDVLLEMVKKIREKIPNLNYYKEETEEWLKKLQEKNPYLFR